MISTRIRNPHQRSLPPLAIWIVAGLAAIYVSPAAQAATLWWNGGSGTWNKKQNWSTVSTGNVPNPLNPPGSTDDGIFNITSLTTAQTVNLEANQSALSLTFNSTGTVLLEGGSIGNQTLTLGTGGLTASSGAGAVTMGSATAGQNVAVILGGSQSWANNSSSLLTIQNGVTTNAFTLTLNGSGSGGTTFNGALTNNTGALALTANTTGGTTTLAATGNSYTGATTLTAGNLSLTGSLTGATAIAINGGTFTESSAGVIGSAAATLTIGGGTATLSGANTYTGSTTLNSGTLNLNNAAALGATPAVALNGGTISNTLGTAISSTASGSIGGSFTFGSAGQTSANNLGLTGTTGFSADLTKTITLNGTGTTLTLASTWTNNNNAGRTLTVNGTGNTLALGGLALNTASNSAQTQTINGSGNVTMVGAVTSGSTVLTQALTYSGTGTLTLQGNNTYTGATNVSGGTVNVNGTLASTVIGLSGGTMALGPTNNRLSSSAAVTLMGGTLSLTANSDTVTSVSLQSGSITGSGGTLTSTTTFDVRAGSVSAKLGGSVGLTKTTGGTVTLSAANTYTGATNIATSGGTLSAAADGALGGTSGITVNSSGTLLLAGAGATDRVNNSAALALAGGTLSMQGLSGASETLGALTLSADSTIDFGTGDTNSLTFSSVSLGLFHLAVTHWTGTYYTAGETTDHGPASEDRLLFSSLSLTGAELAQISFYNDAGVFIGTGKQISFGGTPEIVPVPEPATIFGALALVGLAGWRERRRFYTKPVNVPVAS